MTQIINRAVRIGNYLKLLCTPFAKIDKKVLYSIFFCEFCLFLYAWLNLVPEHSFIPRLDVVGKAWLSMWNDGLWWHFKQSMKLAGLSISIAVVISALIAYSYTIPLTQGIAMAITKLRFNPIQGLTLYFTIASGGGRSLQVWLMVIFMTFYFITALISMIKAIPEEDFLRRKAQGMGGWKILYKVVIKDRADYLLEIVRQNLSIAFMMLVSVEAMNKNSGGLGAMIFENNRNLVFEKIVALQITIFVIGIALDIIIKYLYSWFPANAPKQ